MVYTLFPSKDKVAEALESLPNAGALDEALVMLVAKAYVEGELVLLQDTNLETAGKG